MLIQIVALVALRSSTFTERSGALVLDDVAVAALHDEP
jgi:hypothetical protein